VYEDTIFSTPMPTFVGGVLDGSYSNRSKVESSVVFISFPLCPRMMSIFSYVFLPFGLLPLKNFCSIQLPISLLGHWLKGVSFELYKSTFS
jgi:hypothetical protein